jgi:rubrerythrin
MLQDYQVEIIDLYHKQELLLSELYQIFSDQFADYRDFWLSISKEEKRHALWLENLKEKALGQELAFDEGKTRTDTLKAFIEYMIKVTARAKNRELSLKQALALSRDIENSLIEKNFFRSFSGATGELVTTFKKLETETRNHLQKIQKAFFECKE